MLDDMRMRKMAEHTQDGYIRAVRKLAAFLGRSPDTATIEELRSFQLHLVDAGTPSSTPFVRFRRFEQLGGTANQRLTEHFR
jgi:putative heme iron utilization protein